MCSFPIPQQSRGKFRRCFHRCSCHFLQSPGCVPSILVGDTFFKKYQKSKIKNYILNSHFTSEIFPSTALTSHFLPPLPLPSSFVPVSPPTPPSRLHPEVDNQTLNPRHQYSSSHPPFIPFLSYFIQIYPLSDWLGTITASCSVLRNKRPEVGLDSPIPDLFSRPLSAAIAYRL